MARSAVAALLIIGSLGGCTAPGANTVEPNAAADSTVSDALGNADKVGDGEIRTKTESLTSRWPLLGTDADIESAHWMSGQLGSDRAPGPASYWIDAVIVVTDAAMTAITGEYELAPVETPVGIEPELEVLLPDEEPIGSPELDAATGTDFRAEVFVYPEANTVVIIARFGN